MANKKPIATDKQKGKPMPSEAEVREFFQKIFYVNPTTDDEGTPMSAKLDLAGPIYPGWGATRDANRTNGPVRRATQEELDKFNKIMTHEGPEAARQWLNEEWSDD